MRRLKLILFIMILPLVLCSCKKRNEYSQLLNYINNNANARFYDLYLKNEENLVLEYECVYSPDDIDGVINSYNSFVLDNSSYLSSNIKYVDIYFYDGLNHELPVAHIRNSNDTVVVDNLEIGSYAVDCYGLNSFNGCFSNINYLCINCLRSYENEDLVCFDGMDSIQEIYIINCYGNDSNLAHDIYDLYPDLCVFYVDPVSLNQVVLGNYDGNQMPPLYELFINEDIQSIYNAFSNDIRCREGFDEQLSSFLESIFEYGLVYNNCRVCQITDLDSQKYNVGKCTYYDLNYRIYDIYDLVGNTYLLDIHYTIVDSENPNLEGIRGISLSQQLVNGEDNINELILSIGD